MMAQEALIFADDAAGITPSGHVLRISPVPNALEVEPNNGFDNATPVATFPASFNGILRSPAMSIFTNLRQPQGRSLKLNATDAECDLRLTL